MHPFIDSNTPSILRKHSKALLGSVKLNLMSVVDFLQTDQTLMGFGFIAFRNFPVYSFNRILI